MLKSLKIKEEVRVITDVYPDLSINKQLIIDADNEKPRDMNVSAVQVQQMSKWWVETPAVNTIVDWAVDIIRKSNPFVEDHTFTIVSSWFAKYSKGDYALTHHHFPAQYSFAYYINIPSGSPPLVLTTSNTEIPVQEGQVVILPCGTFHHVDKCDVDDRLVLAGNFYLTPPKMDVSMEGFYAGGYEWDD